MKKQKAIKIILHKINSSQYLTKNIYFLAIVLAIFFKYIFLLITMQSIYILNNNIYKLIINLIINLNKTFLILNIGWSDL